MDGREMRTPVGVLPPEVVVVVPPVLGGYLRPLLAQEPFEGASMLLVSLHATANRAGYAPIGTKTPSKREPLTLKYHSISLIAVPSQLSAGVTPVAAFSAAVSVASVNVLLVEGVMPAAERKSKVGSVCNQLKNGTSGLTAAGTYLEQLHDLLEEGDRLRYPKV